ncbi:MAG: hypothetical protein ACJ76Z_08130 [Thermoleophilaceae bacterium]
MKALKGLMTLIAALALLALPAGAIAKSRDRNHDRIPDKWEKRHNLSTRVNVARKDPDKDGLSNLSEFRHGTDPRAADTDDDGVDDGDELRDGTNPDDADTDNDGVRDGDEVAGTITSFDGTTLTIQLPGDGAGTFAGTVTDATVIECDRDDATAPPTATAADDGRDSDGGDHSGPGDGSTTIASGDDANENQGEDENENQGESDDENENDDRCTTADLTSGTVVHEAKFTTAGGVNTFTKIELAK